MVHSVTWTIPHKDEVDARNQTYFRRKRWVFIPLILLCILVGLASYTVYKEFRVSKGKEKILTYYGALFRNIEDVIPGTGSTSPVIQMNMTGIGDIRICTDNCPAKTNGTNEEDGGKLGRLTGSQYKYHGCCISRSKVYSPNTALNEHGHEVRLVSYKDQRQVFRYEECHVAPRCSGCTCTRDVHEAIALVADLHDESQDFDSSRLEWIQTVGFCKCMNN